MKAIWIVCGCGLALFGCEQKKNEPSLAPSATSLEVSKPASKALHYEIQKDGKTTLDMPGKIEDIKADTTASDGSLDVDLTDISKSVGEVKVDLTTLTTHTFPDSKKDDNEAQTGHARNWMEVGDAYPKETIDRYRWAKFAIRSIDTVSMTD